MNDKVDKGGRPALFKDPEQLQEKINQYFDEKKPIPLLDKEGNVLKDKDGKHVIDLNPPTLTGLALHLGFVSRQSIYDYESRNDQFSYIIKKARLQCENFVEKNTMLGKIPPAPGIFFLKNYGWKDKFEIANDLTIKLKLPSDLEDE